MNKGYETFVSFKFLEVNLTSFPPKCFIQKNKIELCFEKIDAVASNREAVNNFGSDATL